MQSGHKILHWLLFLTFLMLSVTALAANFFFSKEAIMESFAFSLPALDIDIPPTDQLFIARVARRDTWEIHFWTGVVLGTLAICQFLLFWLGKKRYKWLHTLSFTLFMTMLLSGLPLYLRLYFDISAPLQQLARTIHFYTAWGLVLFVVTHLATIIVKENSSQPGIISKMFQFKLLLLTLTLMLIPTTHYAGQWEKDPDYRRAMAYKSGKMGVKARQKTIKNCPYAKCDEVSDRIDRNLKTINIRTKNYPKMVAHLRKSLEKGNPLAAKVLAKFLIGRIDYRSKVPDPTLIKIGERDTGMAYRDYLPLARKALKAAAANARDCYSMYTMAQMERNGWMGFAKKPEEARNYYRRVVKKCDTDTFFYVMSRARLKE